MKVISFLGTGPYKRVKYKFSDGFLKEEDFFPLVLLHYLLEKGEGALDVLLLVSEEVLRHKNWFHFQGRIKTMPAVSLHPIVYEWRREEKLWEVFLALDEKIGEGQKVVVDITHSFRFIPFIMVMMINYLEKVKGGKIAGVYYGNFEARDEKTGEVPVFEIGQFMRLLDWTFSVEFFLKTGNAKVATELLRKENAELHKRGNRPRHLSGFSSLINSLSSDLINLNWKGARRIRERILNFPAEALEDEVRERLPFAVPLIRRLHYFGTSLEIGEESWERLTLEELKKQLSLIRWYFNFGYLRNAVVLTREFIVNCWIYVNGIEEGWLREDIRRTEEGKLVEIVRRFAKAEPILRNINSILDVRNAIAHALMKENEMPNLGNVKSFVESLALEEFLSKLEDMKNKYKGVLNEEDEPGG